MAFFNTFSPSLTPSHSNTLHRLSTLLLPSHVQQDDLAQRFRNEKYALRMSRSGFNLLIGWLTEGIGGESVGAGEGFSGEKGKRGRTAVMRVVNNHLRFDGMHVSVLRSNLTNLFSVTSSSTTSVPSYAWEESTGLLSSLVPRVGGSNDKRTQADPAAFNTSKGELKLGPAPIDDALSEETRRIIREHGEAGDDDSDPKLATSGGIVAPQTSDMLPFPTTFRTIDIKREVDKARDARKRIKLDPTLLSVEKDNSSAQAAVARARALPSICAYTLHDVGDGYARITLNSFVN